MAVKEVETIFEQTESSLDAQLEELMKRTFEPAQLWIKDGRRQYQVGDELLKQIKVLGNTNSGHTFLVEDSKGEKEVLKCLSYRSPPGETDHEKTKSLEMFEREIATLEKLNHPQVAKVIRPFTADHLGEVSFFFTQQYFEGPNIEEMIGSGMATKGAVEKMLSLLDAVEYCHKNGVKHRDIKPGNIIWDGEARLVDFGRVVDGEVSSVGGSTLAGTRGYMAPEQWIGQASEASDIYGIGVTLLHMVTGVNPQQMINEDARSFEEMFVLNYEEHMVGLDSNIQDVLRKCLQLKAEDRYQNVRELRENLEYVLDPSSRPSRKAQKKFSWTNSEKILEISKGILIGTIFGMSALTAYKFLTYEDRLQKAPVVAVEDFSTFVAGKTFTAKSSGRFSPDHKGYGPEADYVVSLSVRYQVTDPGTATRFIEGAQLLPPAKQLEQIERVLTGSSMNFLERILVTTATAYDKQIPHENFERYIKPHVLDELKRNFGHQYRFRSLDLVVTPILPSKGPVDGEAHGM